MASADKGFCGRKEISFLKDVGKGTRNKRLAIKTRGEGRGIVARLWAERALRIRPLEFVKR